MLDKLNPKDVIFLKNPTKDMTGYEKYYEQFEKLKSIYYKGINEDIGSNIINEIIDIYYNEKIFPMNYLSNKSIEDNIIKIKKSKLIIDDNNVLKGRSLYGLDACRNIVNNIHKACGTGRGVNGELSSFCNRKLLFRTIKFVMDSGEVPYPNKIRRAFALTSGSVQNFPPSKAKAVYDKYCKDGYVVYDYSSGFGGRLLGALSSIHDITYIGTDPNTETYINLLELKNIAENCLNKKNKSYIFNNVSEEMIMDENSIDFAFSSPPYFDTEIYSDEETQCNVRYKKYDNWLKYYVDPTIKNIKSSLKPNSLLLTNISNNKKHNLYDDWLDICLKNNFELIEEITFKLTQCGKANRKNEEKIMVLKNIK